MFLFLHNPLEFNATLFGGMALGENIVPVQNLADSLGAVTK
jgi:hypothetical protein